ncbi:MAG: amino acid adenylation domain-containing protein [Blastocatellia bacterium]
MQERLERLVVSGVRGDGVSVWDMELMSGQERAQLLYHFNQPNTHYFSEGTLAGLFEGQVKRSPHAIATAFEQQRMTYKELNDRANQLARYLRRHGAGPEVLVGLCVERSLNMIVCILGILKAGAAYLPLDPAYPKQRLAFLVEDSQAPLLLTEQRHLGTLPTGIARTVCIDAEWDSICQASTDNLRTTALADNAAYVIYTSGSTGKPKGVLVSNANVIRLFEATRLWFRFSDEDVWTMFHSCSFDFSVWEIWGALLHGGRLVVVPYWASRSPEAFYDLLISEQVTFLNQTPSAFRQLIAVDEAVETAKELKLRSIIFGGEALDLQSLKPWFDRHGDESPALVNMYGITETTVHVTYHPLSAADLNRGWRSIIGRPIGDLQVYVLDLHHGLSPVGVPGEMFVAGDGLTRGYLNHPELTAERFIPNPFSSVAGERLYRSGDLARYLPGGEIEFLGRTDYQVKVRGFRIETGEIEAAINAHQATRQSVVVMREDVPGSRQLVAYVIADSRQNLSTDELRLHLKERIPDYMLPAAFVFMDALPLTPNGKVDRRALPAADPAGPEMRQGFVAPRTPIEQALAEVWSKALRVERVGINDNFFALGGDSIHSIKVRTEAQKKGVDFSVQQLFRHQTIGELARIINVQEGVALPEAHRPFDLISDEDRLRLSDQVEDAYPISQLQAGLIFHSEYSPDYIIYLSAFHIRMPLDVQKFQAAVDQLADRHTMLRTSFNLADFSEPLQLVHRVAPIRVEVTDLRHLSPEEQEQRLDGWMKSEMTRKFDWSRCPLLRFHLHRRDEESFQFTLSEPFFDGWSVASLLTELFERYLSLLSGEPTPVEPPLCSYAAFVSLERKALGSKECRDYWAGKLADAPASNIYRWQPAGSDEAEGRMAADGLQVRRLRVPISSDISERLKRFAQLAGVPVKSALLASHLKVVSILGGQSDVITGVLTNGRPEQVDGEKILGIFLNTLPFRLELGEGTWADIARGAFESERESLPFRRFPFQELQRLFGAESLFNTAFNFTHFHVYKRLKELGGMEVFDGWGSEQTYYALTAQFNIDEDSSQISLALDYRAIELCAAQAERIAEYYLNVLDAMTDNPFERHGRHCLLPEKELHQLLYEWNDTQAIPARPPRMHDLFESQVERTPDAVAIVCDDERVTYGDLNRRANQLAHRLKEMGAGPEFHAGICMLRGVDMIVAMIGVLKAGGAYVPLDPLYPLERLAFMLNDAGVKVVLTHSDLAGRVPQFGGEILCLNREREAIGTQSEDNPESLVTADNLAYTIYTSGSTGRPKGVAIEHRSAVTFLIWAAGQFHVGPGAGVLASTSICFDLSVFEIFAPLGNGGKVIVAESALDLPSLAAAHEVTLINTVPLAMADLLMNRAIPDSVETINLAGEPLSNQLAQEAYGRRGIKQVFNLYGPTEDTTYSTFTLVDRGSNRQPPIGHPIANEQVYILDARQQPVATATVGELYIGGHGLARGYLNRPDLTAERFIPDPFSKEPSARLYRTGDLARHLPGGEIEYAGRMDHQVKIRGYRIEPAEIEAALSEHAAARDVVVLACEDTPGDKRLIAYVVVREGPPPAVIEWRSFLRARLPEYMVPSAFVVLNAMPLTPSGKIDRRALPPPGPVAVEPCDTFMAPRTPVEEALSAIWSDLLRVNRLGVLDNFFDLGGHSLMATQLVSRVREAFEVELPIRSLFENSTIEKFAAAIEKAMGRRRDLYPAIQPAPRATRPPLSFAQQRLWFLDQLEPGNPFYNILAAVRLTGPLDVATLSRSVDEIARRHETLRTSLDVMDGQLVQTVRPAYDDAAMALLPLSIVDLRRLPEDKKEAEALRLSAEEGQRPFDLARGPLLRVKLVRLAKDHHVFILVMHHIISDGWSIGVFIKEMSALYDAFLNGKPSPLPELPIQYADFAIWQREWLEESRLSAQLGYWKESLSGVLPVLELPTDRPRPAIQTYRGAHEYAELSNGLVGQLKALGRRGGATLFMIMVAGFKSLLHRYTGQEDIIIGTPIANRNRAELEGLIGFFVNTLVLRTALPGVITFKELLRTVREVALGAYAHQDVPFERLVEHLQPERDMSRAPVFQVMAVMQSAPVQELYLPGLSLSLMDVESNTAKFDLSLLMEETPQGLNATVEYNTDLFDRDTVRRMLSHLENLLAAAVANPTARVCDLPLLSEAESHQLLVEFNDTYVSRPRGQTIHGLFEEQAERTPDAIAVEFGDRRLSYRDLNRRADSLAHYLRGRLVGPEVRVGICMERSLEMIVGVMGVLKAGGAYVPVDIASPKDRLEFMLGDADVKLLLTQNRLRERLSWYGGETLLLDSDWTGVAMQGASVAPAPARPENIAYVIYTSGSTGKPKGVMVDHRALINHALATVEVYRLGPGERFMQFFSLSFDASAEDIFPTLISGATLVCYDNYGEYSAGDLLSFCGRHRVSIMHLPVALWHEIVDHLANNRHGPPDSLRTLSVGGESPSLERLQTWSRLVGDNVEFRNVYGPTEATITVTVYGAGNDVKPLSGKAVIPIGRPLANLRIHILDLFLRPVPIGIPGELHISGVGLSRGYLNEPGLTAEKFIPDPYGKEPGSRLYKTGDLARYLSDGNMEFLGRIDHQVKIRGYRVEPAEVESALMSHPALRDVVVLARADTSSERRLAAYLVTRHNEPITAGELRQYAKGKLPEYMVPSVFVVLKEMPLTTSGKIDRRALAAVGSTGSEFEEPFMPPRTPLERALARIYSEALNVERVGVNDNFFDLGGHSLLAARVIARIREGFMLRIPLRKIFEEPTIAGLAAIIRRQHVEEARVDEIAQRLLNQDSIKPGS